jgi:hypothetical protein
VRRTCELRLLLSVSSLVSDDVANNCACGCRVLRFRVEGLVSGVPSPVFRVSGLGFRVYSVAFRVQGVDSAT